MRRNRLPEDTQIICSFPCQWHQRKFVCSQNIFFCPSNLLTETPPFNLNGRPLTKKSHRVIVNVCYLLVLDLSGRQILNGGPSASVSTTSILANNFCAVNVENSCRKTRNISNQIFVCFRVRSPNCCTQ